MKVRYIKTEKAVGTVICHDVTQITVGEERFKGALFKKGHRIREQDVEKLLDIGKYHVYAIELEDGELHEDDAGLRLAQALKGPGIMIKGPSEGRLNLIAAGDGLLKVDASRLMSINSVVDVVVSTLHNNSPVQAGAVVAGAKVIPLAVKEEIVDQVESVCAAGPAVIKVIPYKKKKIGVVVTGQEVADGRIKDGFGPVLQRKAAAYALDSPDVVLAGDDVDNITAEIRNMHSQGCEIIITTGGMSVDPDDVTPSAIRKAGATIVRYGAPVLPGAMFMIAYLGETCIIGLPACGMYYKTTVFDIFLPRILAGEKIKAEDIIELGHGGLCRGCEDCRFPNCSFGEGGM